MHVCTSVHHVHTKEASTAKSSEIRSLKTQIKDLQAEVQQLTDCNPVSHLLKREPMQTLVNQVPQHT